jgi:hypothetical protein
MSNGFTIKLQTKQEHYDESHTIEIKDSGVVEIRKDGEQVAAYSQSFWLSIKPGEPPKPKSARVHKIR